MSNTFKLIIAIAVSELVGVIGSLFMVTATSAWYEGLLKPTMMPPAWVFGPVWTILFALMGVAAFLVWRNGLGRKDVRQALLIFVGQLVINALWPFLFFGQHKVFFALLAIVVLWFAIVLTMLAFYQISKHAAYLLVPYLLWVSFAAYLNYSICALNH